MINIKRVALEVKTVGLYDGVLQDVQKIAKKRRLTEKEIEHIIIDNPQIMDLYKQVNVEYNISNIHIKDIPLDKVKEENLDKAKKINDNLTVLKDIEKYTIGFEQSSVLVMVMSIEFFVIFSVQYFIVLLDMKEWQWEIYGLFAMSIIVAWLYSRKQEKIFKEKGSHFEGLYEETLGLIDELETSGCLKKQDLLIAECDEHI